MANEIAIPVGYESLFQDAPSASVNAVKEQQGSQMPAGYENLAEDNTQPAKVSPTGLTSEPAAGWQQGYKALSDRLTIGGGTIGRGAAGVATVFGMSFKDAQKVVEDDNLARAQKDTQDYVNSNGYFDLMKLQVVPRKGPSPYALQAASYQTELSASEEKEFQQWLKDNDVPFSDGPHSDYDMRGFWKGLMNGDPHAKQEVSNFDGHMHFSDWWKTPYHESFSADSQWATKDAPRWQGNAKDGWVLKAKDGSIVKDERVGVKPPDDNGIKISVADLPGWLIEQIPQMGVTGTGAITGAGVGAIFGGVPGAAIGSLIGGYIPTAFLAAGNHIYDLQSRGVDKHTATVAGSFVGAITGALEMVGLKALFGAAPDVAKEIAKSQGFKQALKAVFGTLSHTMATEVSTEATESLVESTSKIITARLNDKVKPVTSQEVLIDFLQSIVQSAVVSATIGGSSTALGTHAGLVTKAITEKMEAATAQEQQRQAAELLQQQADQRAQDQAQATQVAQNTAQSQAKARKMLKGFAEVRNNVSVEDAAIALVDAQQALDNATADDKPVAKLAVKQAQAQLQQAKLEAQIEELDDALSDPDLFNTVKQHREDLQKRIEKMKETIQDAQADPDTDAATLKKLNKRLGMLKDSLKKVNELEALGSEDKVKEEVTRRKTAVIEKAHKARTDVARAELEGRIEERKQKIAKLSNQTPSARTQARIDTLEDQQNIDEFLLESIDDGTLLEKDLKSLAPKVPSGRLLGVSKIAQGHIEQAAKLAGKEKARFIANAKKLLNRVIKLARLPKADKAALSAAINTDDVQSLTEAIPRLEKAIQEQFDRRRLEAARADLEDVVAKIKSKRKEFSKFPGVEELLKKLRSFIENFEDVAKFEEQFPNISPEDMTDADEQAYMLLDLFPVAKEEMTAKQLEDVIDTLVSLIETGKAERLKLFEQKKARQKQKTSILIQRMTPSAEGQKRAASVEGRVAKLLDDVVNAPANSWRGLMTVVSQFGQMSDMSDLFDVKSALSAMQTARLDWEARFQKLIQDTGIAAGYWHKMLIQGHKRGEKLHYLYPVRDTDGTIIGEKVKVLEHDNGKAMTLWEMMQVRNYLLDEDLDAKSRLSDEENGNGFSYPGQVSKGDSTLESVERYLDEHFTAWRKVADAMRQFYKEFHAVVDEASYRRFGRHIKRNDTYGGELLSAGEGNRFREQFRRLTTKPKSLQARQGGSKYVRITGAFDNLLNHIAQYARESAFLEFEQDAQAVFNNTEVKRLIMRNIGDNTLQIIKKHIEDIVLGSQKAHHLVDKIFSHLRDSLYSRFLNGRPEQFFKQASSFIYALQFVGPKAALEGYAFMLSKPDEANRLMMKSGLYRARIQPQQNVKAGFFNSMKRFNESLGGAVRAGDLFGVNGAAFPVLLKVLKETGSEEKAIKAFETAFDTTQSSGSIDEQPLIFRGSPMLKIFTALAQQPTRNVEDIVTAHRAFRANPSKETFNHYARTVGVMYAGAFLYQAVGFMLMYPMLNDDEREKKLNFILDNFWLGPFSGVAIVGNVLTYLNTSTFKIVFNQNTRAFEPELIPTNVLGDVSLWYTKLLKLGVEGGDAEDAWSALLKVSDAIGGVTGLPSTNILKKFEPFIGVKK